jgi:GWxTD domain-containing protein
MMPLVGQTMRCYTDYRVFHLPSAINEGKDQPYIEFYFDFDGNSLRSFKQEESQFIGAEILITLTKNNQIIGFKKVKALFPWETKEEQRQNCSALERIPAENGDIQVTIEMSDLGEPDQKKNVLSDVISVLNLNKGAFVSDIVWVKASLPTREPNAFTKGAVDILPLISDTRFAEETEIEFYAELYNTALYFKEEPFIVQYSIFDLKNNIIPGLSRIKRESGKPVIPILGKLDISQLNAGEYIFKLEIRDKTNQVVASKERKFYRKSDVDGMGDNAPLVDFTFVQQFNDSLALLEHIRSLTPIAQGNEKNIIAELMPTYSMTQMQGFMYQFWYKRNPISPELAWNDYKKEVAACQSEFATAIKKGWETDRGRVYLQYGKPSTRVVRNHDPDYWPFEIWHYYQTNNNLHNKRLLFYNTSLNGDMELLHSDIPNEVTNFDWKNMVRSRQMNDPTTVNRLQNNQRQDPYSGDELESLWYNPH